MKLSTYLINSTKKEYIPIQYHYPEHTSAYMSELEKHSAWNLRHDNIYVIHSSTAFGYEDVRYRLYKTLETDGEVIHEYLDFKYMEH